MYLTWLDNNSWLIEIGGKRILLDPWLVGELVFSNLNWLLKGSKRNQLPIPEDIDLILLSQGLEDHAHPPTLKQLNRNIPVVGSPSAAKVAQDLGYKQVTALTHNQTFTLDKNVEIKATVGTSLGPFVTENGYLLTELSTGCTLYYEPHGNHPPSLKEIAPIDIVITPIIDVTLPLVGSIIKGTKNALDVAKMLQPQVMLPTAAGGDVTFEGLIQYAMRNVGSITEFRSTLIKNNLKTQVIEPMPGERFELQLEPRVKSPQLSNSI